MEQERVCEKYAFGFVPAAVGVSTEQHLSAATAHGAVRLVAIVIIHVGDFQINILTHAQIKTHVNNLHILVSNQPESRSSVSCCCKQSVTG